MKVWLFGTYAWQGNPKALFLYMIKYCLYTHECWWIADTEKEANILKDQYKIDNITYGSSKKAKELFARADVYVTENFRENYPLELAEKTKIFNTWHGVGLKHIEKSLGFNSILSDSISKKYIKNFSRYRDKTIFLVTSEKMQEHFLQDTIVPKEHILQGIYPRNVAYHNSQLTTYQLEDILYKPENEYNQIILFAPTYRTKEIEGVFQYLLPDLNALDEILLKNNQLLIIKVHPFMTKDRYFLNTKEKYQHHPNILFWDSVLDIYEIFSKIDVAIIDYSSIFYDLLDAGVQKFIRYIPDYEEYNQQMDMIADYYEHTDGIIVENFQDLLDVLQNNSIDVISKKTFLVDYFFGYKNNSQSCQSIHSIIDAVDNFMLTSSTTKELHTFDVFDTLIRRSTLKPFSIFSYVEQQAKSSNLDYPEYLLENWVTIRNKVEHDVRDMMRKTTFERQSDTLEICLDDIYQRLSENFALTQEQIDFLKTAEVEAEISHVEPIVSKIELLFSLKNQGHDVALVSDMYLPELVIRQMLEKADDRLKEIPLYLSSDIGYQKSTGKLYQYIFFDIDYQYCKWVHYGDNKHADGIVPRRYGIQTCVHDADDFIPFESQLVDNVSSGLKYTAYQLAAKMQRYRVALINNMNNSELEKHYYAYAYVGLTIVPYVHWVIRDAIRRGYETLYFISRDGYFLKQVADEIIQMKNYLIKTKYIYGSRKAWRLPSFIHEVDQEMFGQFGNFVGMDSFEDLVKASWISEAELLEIFPQFESLRSEKHLRGSIAENIRKTFLSSQIYCQKILKLAKQKRVLVRKYLQQEIDFGEKFAFVEFWGRGYTQDVFGRLLNDASDREILNPFYYVRSFTNNTKNSIRHNFILTPQNFSFFEPIFASTPYESISEYQEKDGIVEPVIVSAENSIHAIISTGLKDFVHDYLSLSVVNDNLDYNLANYNYHYQMTNPNDQFICNVFGELKDNISSYGEAKSYAPALNIKKLSGISSKQELDKLTTSISISLAKSDSKTREFYQKIYQKYKLPRMQVEPIKLVYAINNLDSYVYGAIFPFEVIAIKPNKFYYDVSFIEANKRQDITLDELEVIEVLAIDWIKAGVPRLLTKHGYLTANKGWVQRLDEVGDFIQYDETLQKYIWKPKGLVSVLLEALRQYNKADIKQPIVIKESKSKSTNIKPVADENFLQFQKKFYKFTKDPYGFFKDVKNPRLKTMKHLFDEKHKIGKSLSNLVRKTF